jgi:hypothetical protein
MITVYSDNEVERPANGHVGGIYMHGDIENRAGIDLVVMPRDVYESLTDGVSPVEVIVDGKPNKCVMFVWNREYFGKAGLIVDPNDAASSAYAVRKWMEKPLHI